jgi:hypothetical protein
LKRLWNDLQNIAELHNRGWKPFRLVVLRSEAGCSKQETHTDGTSGNPEIGGILIAVENETFFGVNGTKLELRAGDAVAFHGSTPHNGEAYQNNNVRYHVYLAKKEGDVPTDEVGKFDLVCDTCSVGFETKDQKRYHICPMDSPDKKEALRERKRKNSSDRRYRIEQEKKSN